MINGIFQNYLYQLQRADLYKKTDPNQSALRNGQKGQDNKINLEYLALAKHPETKAAIEITKKFLGLKDQKDQLNHGTEEVIYRFLLFLDDLDGTSDSSIDLAKLWQNIPELELKDRLPEFLDLQSKHKNAEMPGFKSTLKAIRTKFILGK